jgi:hypothetical protein
MQLLLALRTVPGILDSRQCLILEVPVPGSYMYSWYLFIGRSVYNVHIDESSSGTPQDCQSLGVLLLSCSTTVLLRESFL